MRMQPWLQLAQAVGAVRVYKRVRGYMVGQVYLQQGRLPAEWLAGPGARLGAGQPIGQAAEPQ